ncbi:MULTISPECIES: DUF3078 domain-containing protein [unclassified Mucilaginibacter]|uniref:DUF3078 domain-containing protein n=1 Tax=unclassified Mucilaginibacter TaxID=2617802 RepID=UPI00138C044C|nr:MULTISPECIES: DUF3078 domain-containing protein [unclassified Mucilaginibacter]MBB5397287.1 hypothetical protein [Mucilaginibacter sp. AK015]QHS54878.1 DUF3078 domain-containing protein [Mucilaginibacter sp. 14171R-50]
MLKTSIRLFFLLSFTITLSASAQITDTVKKDTVKIDTNLLNRYRIPTKKNVIPVPPTPIKIQQELIPVTMLDYKISYWRKFITFGLNFSQAAFSDNYAAGGVTAVALSSNFIYRVEYNKAPFSYTSELNLLYGKSKNKGQSSRKSNDRIFFDNKVATQLSKHWFFFGSLSFESQFDKGYQYNDASGAVLAQPLVISNFMSPGYLTESIGFEYKPTTYFDLRFGTGTARQTFVLDTTIYHNQPANYGVTPGKTIRTDVAFQMVAIFDKDIAKNMHLNTRYDMFIPYGQSLSYVRHRVDAVLAAKVNRLINVSINGTLLFDKNTSSTIQGTEGLALGILYKFP